MGNGARTFESDASSFSLTNACRLADASRLAYASPKAIQETVAGWGMSRFAFLDQDHTQAFVSGDDGCVLVAFRGTEPDQLQDWLTDAKVRKVAGPLAGEVHRGFLGALESVREPLEARIEAWSADGQSVWLTGHSLGGAVAVLAAATLAPGGVPVQGVYTYGQPRVGDHAFARRYDQALGDRTFRFVNHTDVVARVPPRAFGYRHVGSLRFLDEDGDLHDEPSFWVKLLTRVQVRMDDLGDPGTAGIKAHDASGYVRAIDNLA